MNEPRKLGLVGKAIVGLMVVVAVGLVVGFGVAVRAKMIEEDESELRRVEAEEARRLEVRRPFLPIFGAR